MLFKQKQGFSSIDFLTILFSIAIIGYIATPIVSKNLQSDEISKAQQDIVQISKSLLEPPVSHELKLISSKTSLTQRGIASVSGSLDINPAVAELSGEVGVDPWGTPYHYLFVRNNSGVQTHIIVWSDGPDRLGQTEVKTQLSQRRSSGIVAFQGDDLGFVTPVR